MPRQKNFVYAAQPVTPGPLRMGLSSFKILADLLFQLKKVLTNLPEFFNLLVE